MHQSNKLLVIAEWDGEAGVWVATSDDIPGLVTEAASLDELLKRVTAIAPELIEDNAHLMDRDDSFSDLVDVCIHSILRREGHDAR